MLEAIKKLIYSKYGANDRVGLFYSLFDQKGILLDSHGVVETDKNLDALIDLLYTGMIKKQELKVKKMAFDIVSELKPQQDVAAFLQLSPKEYGIVLVSVSGGKSGVLLPNTAGIETMQQALAAIKTKHQLSGNVSISTFKTDRLVRTK
ncbi:MAG: hypothetical protein PHU61_00450 [Candidatus Absconditabacteria bacterium]|nr:hypothetical protein [Candidatus Absconditabacteria bacterium]MDD3868557.1 hypothetical protein [Candidatus Absconditabacteria bacterium]MDD4714121.1 hypothetical protein [Candidatus Absconditabacteria bacterium]